MEQAKARMRAHYEQVRGDDLCDIIVAPWLVNGGHGASLRHHNAAACVRLRSTGIPSRVGPVVLSMTPGRAGGWRA
eukprot:COSAG01_NODE_1641_length_9647_cov_5.299539_2_plen_76_part_00